VEKQVELTELASRLQDALGHTYAIERELGGGGMSRVFIATETELGRRVVLKVLPPDLAAGLSLDRFRREVQLAASLQHPHIVPLLAAGSAGGVLYYTMPLIEGESLRTRIAREGELPIGQTIRIMRDVVDALACAHERGIVHRDIKPDNVLISRHHALVTDFGVAKALSEATGPSSVTSAGVALGTPAYMAPEQATADPHIDHRADIYAVGALGYEMLTGHPPFSGSSPQAVLAAQVTQRPEPVDKARGAVPPNLAGLVMRCLEKRPADRWQSAEELLQHLDAMATPSGGTAATLASPGTAGRTERVVAHHPARILALFLAASAVVLVITWLLMLQLGLPDWVLLAAAILLAIGFPIIFATAVVGWRGGSHRLFNWPKAISGGFLAFAGLGILTAGYMLARALGIGPVGSLIAAGTLRDRERIIVADFENRTGDRLLGDALTEAFRVDFAQSPSVTAVEPEFVRDVLGRMGKPDSVRVDLPLAREVAIREGIKAVIAGDIRPAGSQFVLSARLVGAEDGGVLAAYRETAKDSGEVIRAVDRLSKRLRTRIGESLRSVRASPPLERVTTSSMDALRKYSRGLQVADQGDVARGVALLEEAIALDSGFAMAHRKVGVLLWNTQQRRSRMIAALTKAFEFRNRLTNRERYLAEGSYYSGVTGERDKARDAYRTLLDTDPNESIALNNLGLEYMWVRDYNAAAQVYARAIAVESSLTYYTNLGFALFAQGSTDSARAVLQLAERKFPGNPLAEVYLAFLHSATEGYDSASSRLRPLVEERQPDPTWRSFSAFHLANIAAARGCLVEANRWIQTAKSAEEERDAVPGYLRFAAWQSLVTALVQGRSSEAVRQLETALARHPLDSLTPAERPYLDLAKAYAATERPARARSLLDEYERIVPVSLRRNEEPQRLITRGFLALAENRPQEAIAAFRSADHGDCQICALAGLGRSYDLAGQPDSALAVYERYLATPGLYRIMDGDGIWLPALHYRLGELYEGRGEREKAASHFGRFIDLWRGADPVLQPRVAEARRHLAALTAEPRP
jgi:tetratricopeptide (TPR) repeat protein